MTNKEKILLIACGALAKEIMDIIELNKLEHIELECLPAQLHNTPDHIPSRVEEKIIEAKGKGYKNIYCVYADCGTGGQLDTVLGQHEVSRIAGPHCYSFFVGNALFPKQSEQEITSFYLTDFLAEHFENFVIKPLGLDKHPELKNIYFEHYEKVIFLAQTENSQLKDKAKAAADYLDLKFEYQFTGYGDLDVTLNQL